MGKRSRNILIIIGGVVLAICVVITAVIFVTGQSSDKKVSDLLALGNRYLSEMDYEQAIAAYQAAIEIDPKCEKAYLALAEIYVVLEDYEAAIGILDQGIEQTGTAKLINYREEIEEIYRRKQDGETNMGASEAAGAVEGAGANGSLEAEATEETDGDSDAGEGEWVSVRRTLFLGYCIEEYDGKGNQMKSTSYDTKGAIGYSTAYEYDEKGNCVKSISYNSDGAMLYYTQYEYDGNGNQVKIVWYNADDTINIYQEAEYDADGNCVKSVEYNVDGTIRSYRISEYDENGRILQMTVYFSDDSVNLYYEYEYDVSGGYVCTGYYPDGEKLLESEYDENGNQVKYTEGTDAGYYETYEWDENGNLLKFGRFEFYESWSDGSISELNANGSTVRVIRYDNRIMESYAENEYDEKGNNTKTTEYNADGSINYYYVTEYDENGNYVKSTTYNADGTER